MGREGERESKGDVSGRLQMAEKIQRDPEIGTVVGPAGACGVPPLDQTCHL